MLTLYMAKLKDYWYEQKLQSDYKTIEYNIVYLDYNFKKKDNRHENNKYQK